MAYVFNPFTGKLDWTNTISAGSSFAGGTNTFVLFDDNHTIGEDSGLSYDKTFQNLTVGNDVFLGGYLGVNNGLLQIGNNSGDWNIYIDSPFGNEALIVRPNSAGTLEFLVLDVSGNQMFDVNTTSGDIYFGTDKVWSAIDQNLLVANALIMGTAFFNDSATSNGSAHQVLSAGPSGGETLWINGPTGAILGTTDTQTLANKRITKRTGTTTSSATPTINTDNVDFYSITAQSGAITSMTTNISGTPTEAQTLWLALTATSGTPAITWGTKFEASTVALPTALSTTRLDLGFVWNTVTSKWRIVATS